MENVDKIHKGEPPADPDKILTATVGAKELVTQQKTTTTTTTVLPASKAAAGK